MATIQAVELVKTTSDSLSERAHTNNLPAIATQLATTRTRIQQERTDIGLSFYQVDELAVFSPDGTTVLAHTDPERYPPMSAHPDVVGPFFLKGSRASRFVETLVAWEETHQLEVVAPIWYEDELVGVVYARLNSEPLLAHMNEPLDRLHALLLALPKPPAGVIAVEVRNPEWLCPDLVALLRDAGARYCVGLHPKLPPLAEQLPLLRALWPGPLVVRWHLNRLHGPFGYAAAEKRYGEFGEMLDPDPDTRAELVRVIRGTAGAGLDVFVTISNKAEGSAPLSVRALAQAIVDG
jgi:hypothetical protein